MFVSPKFLTIMAAATKTIRHYSVSSSSSRPLSISPTRLLLSSSLCSSTVQFPRFSFTRPTSISVRGFSTPPSSSSHFTHPSDDDGDDDSPPTPNSMGGCDWTSPLRVSGIGPEAIRDRRNYGGEGGDGHHWLVVIELSGFEFYSEQKLFDYYIRILATVVGSEEEAKKRIYLVSCGWHYGFGAQIDLETSLKLQVGPYIRCASEDTYYYTRNKDPSVQSAAQYIPINRNRRLENIFSYHHLSERNSEWNFDHWLINIKQPDGGFIGSGEITDLCIEMLAKVVGSEEAAKKIYIIWYKLPFGFGAEIDKEASIKLRGLPDVLNVLPDYAFDIKYTGHGCRVLNVMPSTRGLRFSYQSLTEEYDSEDWLVSMEENVGESADQTYSPLKFDPNVSDPYLIDCGRRLNYKHLFIPMEKAGGNFASIQQRIDCYIQILASVIGSEEAKKKIYRIYDGSRLFGFVIEIDEETSNKLTGMLGVVVVIPDYLIHKWQKGNALTINAFKEMKVDLRGWKCGAGDSVTTRHTYIDNSVG